MNHILYEELSVNLPKRGKNIYNSEKRLVFPAKTKPCTCNWRGIKHMVGAQVCHRRCKCDPIFLPVNKILPVGNFIPLPYISSQFLSHKVTRVWVALGKVLPEFVYFAVEICHRATLPSATLNFPAGKNFANQPKHQTRRCAWVRQADFRKVKLNNRNHSGNCQRLSVRHETQST